MSDQAPLDDVQQFMADRDKPRDAQIETLSQAPTPSLTPTETAQMTAEALRPETSPDQWTLADKVIPIRLIPKKYEDQFRRLAGGLLAKGVDLQGLFKPVEGEADGDQIARFLPVIDGVGEAMDGVVAAVVIIAQGNRMDDVTAEWLEENVSTMEMVPLVMAQLAKYRAGMNLGELLRGFVPAT